METNEAFFADKLMDLANFASAALIFGQLVGEHKLRWPAFVIGVVLLVVCGVVSYVLRKRGKQR